MKTESLVPQKSTSKPNSTADAEIFILHRLLLPHKPLTKTRSLGPKNHPRSLVLRLTLTSSVHIDYSWQRNRWRKLSPWCPKNHPRTQFYGWCWNIHCTRLLLAKKPLTKTKSLGPKTNPRSPVLRLTLKSSVYIGYYRLENHRRKLSPCGQKNHPRSKFLRPTLTSSAHKDYFWLRNRRRKLRPWCQKIILETNYTADAEIFKAYILLLAQKPLTKTSSLLSQKSSSKPSYTADAEIFQAYRLLLAQKPLTKTESLVPQKSSSKPNSTADAEIFILRRLLLPQKPLMKTRSLGTKNHPRSPVLQLTLTSSTHIDYSWQRNRWWKLSPWCPKNHPRTQFYGWRWILQSTQTTAASETVDEN